MVFQSLFTGFLWIILSLFRGEYYVCAVLGATEAEKLQNAGSKKEKDQIKEDYAKVKRNSQLIALAFLGISITCTFVSLLIYRGCCQSEVGSLPTAEEYEKLESAAAVRTFKANIEKLAEEKGRRRADLYFATKTKTSPFEILGRAYQELLNENKFGSSFQKIDDYETIHAEAASAAFQAKVQRQGEKIVDQAVSKIVAESDGKENTLERVRNGRNKMADRYPRSTGNKGKPYVVSKTAIDDCHDTEQMELQPNA